MAVGSFSAALSGLNANASYLGVIGNNLANINTVGFKASTMTFQDLVSQSVSGSSVNPMQVGLGVMVGSVSSVFSQGSIENSRDTTNIALQGNGLFMLKSPDGAKIAYTRAGNFSFNEDGALVSPDGWKVQGWTTVDPTTGAITTAAAPTDVVVPPGVLRAPTVTSSFSMLTNLNAGAATGATLVSAVQIYDALGQAHTLNMTYTKTGAGAWDFKIEGAGAELTGGTVGTPMTLAAGTVAFDATGALTTVTPTGPATGGGTAPTITEVSFVTPTWLDGAAASTLKWGLVDDKNVAKLTGYSAASATSSITQNGAAAGQIDNVTIDAQGNIQASAGSGQSAPVAQIAIASFTNPKGLSKTGSNRFAATASAGVANVGTAGTGGRGTIIGSALESSNVDIAQEFTQMILAQRGYQANSKTITASDEILVETLNLKR
jgi:flagellar hook protein FlgE